MRAVLSHSIVRSLGLVVLMRAILTGAGWSATREVYDGPDDAPLDRLTTLSRQATRSLLCGGLWVDLSPCGRGDGRGEEAGGDGRLISDQQRTEDVKPLTALRPRQLADLPILVNQHDGLMHLKQGVIDDEVNASGSMNHTTRGNRYNDERLDVITDRTITVTAREKFLAMWHDHSRYREWKYVRRLRPQFF